MLLVGQQRASLEFKAHLLNVEGFEEVYRKKK